MILQNPSVTILIIRQLKRATNHGWKVKKHWFSTVDQRFSNDPVPLVGTVFSLGTIFKTVCSRKTQSTQYHSIKSLANQT